MASFGGFFTKLTKTIKTSKYTVYGAGTLLSLFTLLTILGVSITDWNGNPLPDIIKCAGMVEEPCTQNILLYSTSNITFDKSVRIYLNDSTANFTVTKRDSYGKLRNFNITGKTIKAGESWYLQLNISKPSDRSVKWGIGVGLVDKDPVVAGYTPDDFFPKLVSSKADLTEGEIIFNLTNPTTVSAIVNKNVLNFFIRMFTIQDNITGFDVFWKNYTKFQVNETDIIIGKCDTTETTSPNGTKGNKTTCGPSYYVPTNRNSTRILEEWEAFPIVISKNASVEVKIVVKWPAKLGDYRQDLVPGVYILGAWYNQTKWIWLNNSYRLRTTWQENQTISTLGGDDTTTPRWTYVLNSSCALNVTATTTCGFDISGLIPVKLDINCGGARLGNATNTSEINMEVGPGSCNVKNAGVYYSPNYPTTNTNATGQQFGLHYGDTENTSNRVWGSVWANAGVKKALAVYTFDWSGTSVVNDSTVNRMNGSIDGSQAKVNVSGILGSAIQFIGANGLSNMTIPTNVWDSSVNNFSVMFWYKPDGFGSASISYLLTKAGGGGNDLNLYVYGTNGLYCGVNADSYIEQNIALTLVPNTWNLIACTYDGANVNAYINSITSSGALTGNLVHTASRPFELGFNPDSAGRPTIGLIDEFRFYNYSLSTAEIYAFAALSTKSYQIGGEESAPAVVVPPQGYTVSTLLVSNGTFSMNTSGLIAYYRFEQSNGSAATNDSSGYGNNGTLTNMNLTGNFTSGPTLNGKFRNALVFDGVNDYVNTQISSLSTWGLSKSLTFMVWININAVQANPYGGGRFISKGGGRASLEMGPAGPQIDFSVSNATANVRPQISKTGFTDRWIHVAGTYNGSLVSLYINGTLVDSAVIYGPINDVGDTIAIGADSGGNVGINGTIDEAMIWNRSLTASEIQMLYNNQMNYSQFVNFVNSTNTTLSINTYSNNTFLGSGGVWNGTLGIGYQSLTVNTSGDNFYAIQEFSIPMNITQSPVTANLYINGTQGNVTNLVYGQPTNATINVSWTRLNNEGAVSLLRNNTPVGTSIIANFRYEELALFGAGLYNYTLNGTGFQNYSFASNITYNLAIAKATPVLIINNNTASINTSGLVGYWRFEQSSGSAATNDSSGYGNMGTLTNMNLTGNATSGITTNGRFGNALNFDGMDDSVNAAQTESLNFTNVITVTAWVKPNTVDGEHAIAHGTVTGAYSTSWYLEQNQAGLLVSINGDYSPYTTSGAFAAGQWTHVAMIYAGSNILGYINGVLYLTNPTTETSITNENGVRIGASGAGAYRFNGIIDEVMVWNRSLTVSEVQMLYQSTAVYGTQTNFTNRSSTSPPVGLNFYRNQTILSNDDNLTLGAGYYYYLLNTTGNANYTAQETPVLPLQITPVSLSFNLYLNGTQGNGNYIYPNATNATGTVSGSLLWGWSLLRNGTPVGIAVGSNLIQEVGVMPAGIWNYSVNTSDTVNYTITNILSGRILTVAQGILTITNTLYINGTQADASYFYPNATNVTATSTNGRYNNEGVLTLYKNGTSVGVLINANRTQEAIINGVGIYNYSSAVIGIQNYTVTQNFINRFLTINYGTIVLHLYLNGTEVDITHTYPYPTNATATRTANEGTLLLLRNGAGKGINVSSNVEEDALLGVGSYNYSTLLVGLTNYTANTILNRIVIITKGSVILINGSDSNQFVEWGHPVNITLTNATSSLIWLSMDYPGLGNNFTSTVGTFLQYIWNHVYSAIGTFNDTSYSYNMTFKNNITFMQQIDVNVTNITKFSFDLYGYPDPSGNKMKNITIDVGSNAVSDTQVIGSIERNYSMQNEINGSNTQFNLSFTSGGTQIAYLRAFKNVTYAQMNITGYGTSIDLNIYNTSITMCGNYTGYDNIYIRNVTVTICPYNGNTTSGWLAFTAVFNFTSDVYTKFVGMGAGYRNISGSDGESFDGIPGTGSGRKSGTDGTQPTGGCGAGHAFAGGKGGVGDGTPSTQCLNGSSYGTSYGWDWRMGSAGGAGLVGNPYAFFSAYQGGNGGGALFINATSVNMLGNVSLDGLKGQNGAARSIPDTECVAGGGGGSAGDFVIHAMYIYANTLRITLTGGDGGNEGFDHTAGNTCGPGGPGAGGHAKFFYKTSFVNASMVLNTSSGVAGKNLDPDGPYSPVSTRSDGNGTSGFNASVAYTTPPSTLIYNPYLQIGTDGINLFAYSGTYTINTTVSNLQSSINKYLKTCKFVNSICDVPVYVGSSTTGIINLNAINITTALDQISINTTTVSSILASNTKLQINISINISYFNNGTLTISNLNFTFIGSRNYTIKSNIDLGANYTSNLTLAVVHSGYNLTGFYDSPDFVLRGLNNTNLPPQGQTNVTAFYNVSNFNYHGLPINVTIRWNQSALPSGGFNVSITTIPLGANNSLYLGTNITTIPQQIVGNLAFGNIQGLWMYFNSINLNRTAFAFFQPDAFFNIFCSRCL